MNQEPKTIPGSIVKYIDILIDLYSPVSLQIRNELRTLQTTLLYGKSGQLDDLVVNMDEKLRLKQKNRAHMRSNPNLFHKEANKQNRQNLANRYRSNTDQSFSEAEQCLNQSLKNYDSESDLSHGQKNTLIPYLGIKKSGKTKQIERKLSNKTLLKIVKKSKTEKGLLTVRSSNNSFNTNGGPFPSSRLLKQKIIEIMQQIESNDRDLLKLETEINMDRDNQIRRYDYGQISGNYN